MRGKINNATVILASATPSIESYYNYKKNKYQYLELPKRYGKAKLPTIHLVDMIEENKKTEKFGAVFSEFMIKKIDSRIKKNEQVILLHNRRGFAPILRCTDCGEISLCPHCKLSLTYHQFDHKLKCHFCNYSAKVFDQCIQCKSINVQLSGTGTQKVEVELKNYKCLIIYPPNQLMDIETPRPDGSLGPLYLASALEKIGIEVDVLDASVGSKEFTLEETFHRRIRQGNGLIRIGMNFNEIADYVQKNNYRIVAISSNFTPQTNMALKTAEAIKEKNNEIKIFAGGINARNLLNRFLKTGNFDGICLSEGEIIFPKMILAVINNYSLAKIPGTASVDKNGKIITNPVDQSCFPKTLDDLQMPKWDSLPFEKYEKIASPHGVNVNDRGAERYAPIMTSRGCPFKCAYCHISEEKNNSAIFGDIGSLRTHSIERVIKEIDYLISLKVKKLFFEDDSLLAHKDRVKTIFKKVRNKKLSIANVNGVNLVHFFNTKNRDGWINGKFDIDTEYLEILKDSGFDQIVFPVESASKRMAC